MIHVSIEPRQIEALTQQAVSAIRSWRVLRPAVALGWLLIALIGVASRAVAQPDNQVYVDQSPRAWDLLQQARDQVGVNVDQAARLYQQLLNDYSDTLVPAGRDESDYFIALSRPVLADLLAHRDLLERYRQVETARARQMLESGDLLTLASTRSLTEPGLEALLRLAQDAIESARFHGARRWLEAAVAHPDLAGRRAAHAWYMTGLCGLYLNDRDLVEQAGGELAGLGEDGAAFVDALNRHAESWAHKAAEVPAEDGDDAGRGLVRLGRPVGQAIWSVQLPDSLMARRLGGPLGQFTEYGTGRIQQSGELLTACPAVADSLVFVNQGYCVLALDRSTGRQIWRYEDRPSMSVIDSESDSIMDLNYIAVGDGSLVTLTGHAYNNQRSTGGRVICLEPATGILRWSADLNLIGGSEDHEGLFPHGKPVIANGAALVMGRRVNPQRLSGCYVLALSLDDGSLLWSRHIASVGGLRAKTYRRFSTLTHDRGDLYVCTPLGAIARLEGLTGRIRWLRRYRIPLDPGDPVTVPGPWSASGPIIRDGRMTCIRPDGQSIVVLDCQSGQLVESRSCITLAEWASPEYLLADAQQVYSVGAALRAFSFDDLTRPQWRWPDPDRPGGEEGTAYGHVEIVGRVQLTSEGLVVPTDNGILIIDRSTGLLRHQIETEMVGNPVAMESQLIVAGAGQVETFMAPDRAGKMLRLRLAEAPDDPTAALSLMDLGLAAGDLPLAMEAADAALPRIEAMGDSPQAAQLQTELFDRLLDVNRRALSGPSPQIEALFALIEGSVSTPRQRVEYLFARADRLADRDPHGAAALYQSIITDQHLGRMMRSEDEIERVGRDWAARRIASLIDRHGADACQPLALEATGRLNDLTAAGSANPTDLRALALDHPCTDAAEKAALLAAGQFVQMGDHRSALASLSWLVDLDSAGARSSTGRLLGTYLSICERVGLTDDAVSTLRFAVEALGDPILSGRGEAVRASALLDSLDAADGQNRLPRIGEQHGTSRVLAGALVPRHAQSRIRLPADRALLVDDGTVRMIDSDGLIARWSNYVGSDAVQLLRFTDGGVLLWIEDDPDDPRAVMLDAADGAQRWTTPRIADHLDDPIADLARLRGAADQMPNGEPFSPEQTVPVANEDWLILIQRTGGVIAFDLHDASTPLWTEKRVLEQVFWVGLRDRTLILAGRGAGPESRGGPGPVVAALDAATGEPVCRLRPGSEADIRWVVFGPMGSIVCGTERAVEAMDLNAGRIIWVSSQPAVRGSMLAWEVGGHAVIQDSARRLRLLEVADAAISDALAVPDLGQWDVLELQDVHVSGDLFYARHRERIVCYDHDGAPVGADAVTDPRYYIDLLASRDRLVLVSRHRTEQVKIPDQSGRRTLRTYRVYVMSENGRLLDAPLELEPLRSQLTDAALIDWWLLLSAGAETFAIPMPAAGQ